MHEMSLCESVIRILEDEAKRQGFSKVRVVRLEIGRLGHVEPEAMSFCFEAVKRDTLAADARLEILTPPGQAWCMDCGKAVEIAQRYDPCPTCAGHRLQVTGGDGMRIKELEVD
ncbi:MAG: hydrogenase maturation nickel metallochaperone HypA [Magnetospirillum sp. WYHS-4]